MARRIVIIQGHPDRSGNHLCHALGNAYAAGAEARGHEVEQIEVAKLDFPLLHTKEEFESEVVPQSLAVAQAAIGRADHLVLIYPLWLGSMPALVKGFLEQVFRPGFAFSIENTSGAWTKLLAGKSARIVVTMGMPAFVYRWFFGAHSLKSLERNILGFCGIKPIRESLFGMVEAADARQREKWLAAMADFGRAGR